MQFVADPKPLLFFLEPTSQRWADRRASDRGSAWSAVRNGSGFPRAGPLEASAAQLSAQAAEGHESTANRSRGHLWVSRTLRHVRECARIPRSAPPRPARPRLCTATGRDGGTRPRRSPALPSARRRRPKAGVAHAEAFEERAEDLVARAPAADRRAVERLADLGGARRLDRTGRARKAQAGFVPFEAAKGHDPPRLAFEIVHHLLITRVQDRIRREHGPPMPHDFRIGAVVAAELSEIGREGLLVEPDGEARQARVDRVADGMDDARLRQRHADQPDIAEVRWHLVCYANGLTALPTSVGGS